MTNGDSARIVAELFAAARELPEAARAAFLAQQCEGNPDLHRKLEAMLLLEAGQQQPSPLAGAGPPSSQTVELPGGWQILEKIGEDAMGSVHKARRPEGVSNRIASVRLLSISATNPEFLARLEAERVTLSTLEHPDIARLYDAGAMHGRPYLVMELVEDGQPAADYCRERRLSADERLALFLRACAAVDSAHQRLIVHGAISSATVLIKPDGSLKLVDLGVAKLFEAADPPPLQTTAVDVHALGGLLSAMLGDRVPRDLQAIVAKAGSAKPYASVAQLAADIERYLAGRPVLAREATTFYRARKFIARHKLPIAAAAVLVVGFFGFAWGFIRASQFRFRAEEQLRETRAMAGMMAMYVPGRIAEIPSSLAVRRKMVSYGLAYLDQQNAERDPADLKQRRILALGYWNVANSLGGPNVRNLGEFLEAARCYRKSLDLMLEDPPLRRDQQIANATGQALVNRAGVLLRMRKSEDAMQAAAECISLASKWTGDSAAAASELSCRATRLAALADLGRAIPNPEIDDLLRRESELEDKSTPPVVRVSSRRLAAQLLLQNGEKAKALQQAIKALDFTGKSNIRGGGSVGEGLSVERGRLLVLAARAEAAGGDASRGSTRFSEALDVLREFARKDAEDVEVRLELARTLVESLTGGDVESEELRTPKARLAEAEELVRGILKDTAYPAAQFLLVRILAARADLANDCGLRTLALEEFARLKSGQGSALPADQPIVDAISAKACAAPGGNKPQP